MVDIEAHHMFFFTPYSNKSTPLMFIDIFWLIFHYFIQGPFLWIEVLFPQLRFECSPSIVNSS